MTNKSYFETIKCVDGELFHMSYHQKRYESVLKSLGVEEVEKLENHLKPPSYGLYRCRLVYSADSISVSYHEYTKRDITSLKVVFTTDIEYSLKSTNRDALDALYDKRGECDDVLIIKDLMVTDTSIANIALYRDGMWLTPKTPLLRGTTRERLLNEGRIVEAQIKVNELRTFSKVALLNAMIDFDVLERCEFLV